jgi:hypothetical protein
MIACQGISIQSIGKLLAGRLEPLEISLSIRSLAWSIHYGLLGSSISGPSASISGPRFFNR